MFKLTLNKIEVGDEDRVDLWPGGDVSVFLDQEWFDHIWLGEPNEVEVLVATQDRRDTAMLQRSLSAQAPKPPSWA